MVYWVRLTIFKILLPTFNVRNTTTNNVPSYMTTKSLASSGKKFCLHLQRNFTLYLCGFILVYFNVGNTRIHIFTKLLVFPIKYIYSLEIKSWKMWNCKKTYIVPKRNCLRQTRQFLKTYKSNHSSHFSWWSTFASSELRNP